MGENVQISRVAVAQGNLTVRITETPQVSQPNALADGRTVEVPRTDIQVDDQSGNRMMALEPGVTLKDLVDGLNALGVGPARPDRDPAGDQGGRRTAGRDRGDLMPVSATATALSVTAARRRSASRRGAPRRRGVRGGVPRPDAHRAHGRPERRRALGWRRRSVRGDAARRIWQADQPQGRHRHRRCGVRQLQRAQEAR